MSSYSQPALSPSSGYSSSSSPLPVYNYQPLTIHHSISSESTALKKRGRKPKPWEDQSFNQKYLQEAKSRDDELKRRNNISSGNYRKRKAEVFEEMEKDIEIQTAKRIALEKKTEKLARQIKRIEALVSNVLSLNNSQPIFNINDL